MGHNSEFRCVCVSLENIGLGFQNLQEARGCLMTVLLPSPGVGGGGRTWNGSVLDGRLIFWPLS